MVIGEKNMVPIMSSQKWRDSIMSAIHHEVSKIAKEGKLKGLYDRYASLAKNLPPDKILVLKLDGMQIRLTQIDLPEIPKIRVMN